MMLVEWSLIQMASKLMVPGIWIMDHSNKWLIVVCYSKGRYYDPYWQIDNLRPKTLLDSFFDYISIIPLRQQRGEEEEFSGTFFQRRRHTQTHTGSIAAIRKIRTRIFSFAPLAAALSALHSGNCCVHICIYEKE